MNLTFFDRTPILLSVDPLVTIGHDGGITFNNGAVRALQLQAGGPVALVRDDDTKRWYACFVPIPGRESATLGGRARQGVALTFSQRHAARAIYEQFSISPERKSLSLPLSTAPTPVSAELRLFGIDTTVLGLPLAPTLPEELAEAPTIRNVVSGPELASAPALAPVVPAPEPEAVASTPEPSAAPLVDAAGRRARANAYTPDQKARILAEGGTVAGREKLAAELGRPISGITTTYYNLRQQKQTDELVKPYVPAAARVAGPKPASALGDKLLGREDDRAHELGMYWYEREMGLATDQELQELGRLLSAIPAGQRGFHLSTTLERAKQEAARRRLALAA